jgi:hypothetical protein
MIFKPQSKSKRILFIIFFIILLGGIVWFVLVKLIPCFKPIKFAHPSEPVFCTQEVKLCPDGSYVGRTGPNCEFTQCPLEKNPEFGNSQIEKAIIDYLLTQNRFSWKTRSDSYNFCVVENLNPEQVLFPLSIWALCEEFIFQNGRLKTLSGSSGPVKINYPNELSFYDLSRFSYEVPGDGSHYSEDIKRIFPQNVQSRIFNFNRDNIIKKIEVIAFDWFNSGQGQGVDFWESIKQAISHCEVEKGYQTHDRVVTITLKNGEELTAIEPQIDDVMILVKEAELKCGKILMGTE